MRNRVLSAAVVLAGAAGVVGLVLARRGEVASAFASMPVLTLALATALHVVVLACRSEAWRVCLLAAAGGGEPVRRRAVHAANAVAYGVGTVQTTGALPARVATLRRIDAARAPRTGQIALCDIPIFLLEVGAAGVVLAGGVLVGRGSPWVAAGALALATGGIAAAVALRTRFPHRALVRGLAVLGHPRHGPALLALVGAIAAMTVVRIALLLAAAGAPDAPGDVAAVFATLGVAGLLPLGPNASPGATLAVAGGAGIAAALTAGLAIAATSIGAVAVYGLLTLVWLTLREPARV